jgi:hypothetical protein
LRLAIAALLILVACDGDRPDAERVITAVDRYRRAENPEKPARADDLRATPCSAADVCRAKEACLASAEPTAKALRLKQEVEKTLGAVERGELPQDSPEARALPKKLDDAEAFLKDGFDHLTSCDAEIIALRRKHRL